MPKSLSERAELTIGPFSLYLTWPEIIIGPGMISMTAWVLSRILLPAGKIQALAMVFGGLGALFGIVLMRSLRRRYGGNPDYLWDLGWALGISGTEAGWVHPKSRKHAVVSWRSYPKKSKYLDSSNRGTFAYTSALNDDAPRIGDVERPVLLPRLIMMPRGKRVVRFEPVLEEPYGMELPVRVSTPGYEDLRSFPINKQGVEEERVRYMHLAHMDVIPHPGYGL